METGLMWFRQILDKKAIGPNYNRPNVNGTKMKRNIYWMKRPFYQCDTGEWLLAMPVN